MWQEAKVEIEALQDLEALEKRLGGRIMDVRHLNDREALVTYAPVVNDSWFVEVWGGEAVLYVIDENGFIVPFTEKYEVDPTATRPVVERVLQDYGVSAEDTGQYYPITAEAEAAFQALLQQAKKKRRPFARR